ncbi:MAG: metallophosphoesterase, partial [Candidatus Caldarchaeum sp.]|nr:metallophosphoesterase [Candidatus Caldarchaeum sp.]
VYKRQAILNTMAEAGKPIFFVPGNCDHPSLLSWKPSNRNVVNLHLNRVEFDRYQFLGIGGGNVSPFNTLIEFREEEFEEMLKTLNPSTDLFILVSHTPPYGVEADFARGKHLGSVAVRKYVEAKRPLAVCCGHIHEARSVSQVGSSAVVNAGPAKEGNYASIELNGRTVRATLSQL